LPEAIVRDSTVGSSDALHSSRNAVSWTAKLSAAPEATEREAGIRSTRTSDPVHLTSLGVTGADGLPVGLVVRPDVGRSVGVEPGVELGVALGSAGGPELADGSGPVAAEFFGSSPPPPIRRTSSTSRTTVTTRRSPRRNQ
jgi:hypothetical protein